MRIEAYYSGIKNANDAVNILKGEGFSNSVVDLNDHYVDFDNSSLGFPGSETATSFSAMIMNSGGFIDDPSKRAMAAASPMASGMGSFQEIADINYKVIINSDSNDFGKIKQIIKETGGEFKNPNVDIANSIEDINLNLL